MSEPKLLLDRVPARLELEPDGTARFVLADGRQLVIEFVDADVWNQFLALAANCKRDVQ